MNPYPPQKPGPGNPITVAPLTWPGGGGQGPQVANQTDEQAKSLARAQRWQELGNLGRDWRLADPRSARAFFYSGLAAEFTGQEQNALSLYGQAIAFDPQLGAAQFGYARSLMRAGDYQRAIGPLQIAVRDFPSVARAWADLGVAYMHSGNPSEAARALQHAVDLDPNDYVNCGLAGQAYALNHQYEQAAPLMEKAITKQPFDSVNVNWMEDLGGMYFYSGNYQRSVQLFQNALRYESNDPNSWYYLWQDYSKLGDNARAQQAHQTMVQLTTPQHPLSPSHDPMAMIMRGQHEAYLHNTGQLNLNEHLP